MGSASKEAFLQFPAKEFCTTIMSYGPPRSGKTFIALKCIEAWLKMGMFEKYILILPSFKNEMNQSYDWLEKYEQVTIYESFHEKYIQKILDEQDKNHDLLKAGKISQMPRIFVFVDDATSQGQSMFMSKTMISVATQNRHYSIHSWFALHYAKRILPALVRQNIRFLFIYQVKNKILEDVYDEYVPSKWKEFDNFKKGFLPFWQKYVENQKFGCLLMAGNESYNPNCCKWFDNDPKPKAPEQPQAKKSNKIISKPKI